MEKTINEVCLSKRTYTLNTGFLEGTDMKRHRIRQWVLVGICGGALLLAGGLGYGYVTDFRPGSPVYSSLAAYRDQVAETGEELFTYTNDTVYAGTFGAIPPIWMYRSWKNGCSGGLSGTLKVPIIRSCQ